MKLKSLLSINIYSSINNVIKTETLPSIPVFVFITNALSTFGIYFGISLFATQLMLENGLKFISKRRQIIYNNQNNRTRKIRHERFRLKLVNSNNY